VPREKIIEKGEDREHEEETGGRLPRQRSREIIGGLVLRRGDREQRYEQMEMEDMRVGMSEMFCSRGERLIFPA
jgi:hypothetical protein